ncbi:uncharacterized protein LOC125177842 [Hyalella azteca]|uniref:Uncharacterized protein LOC125177842 n=1 Tax=Hyalella azteca TaxID=294128 RepID=A0A979FH82_HYAAZ|nr:uncharacterized protein LOC125177842 [Hyalella azteca]
MRSLNASPGQNSTPSSKFFVFGYLSLLLTTFCCLLLILECEGRFKAWKSVAVNTTFLATIAVQNSSYILRSIVQCMNRATTLDWVYVACYTPMQEGGECSLWGYEVSVNLPADSGTQQSHCKLFYQDDGCVLANGSLVAAGTKLPYSMYADVFNVCQVNGRIQQMCEFEGQLYNLNASIGCLLCTTVGVTYGDNNRRRVLDVALPPRDTCCAQAADGYCLSDIAERSTASSISSADDHRMFAGDLGNDVTDELLTRTFNGYPSFVKARVVRDKFTNKSKGYDVEECADTSVGFCEAKTRCEARGLPLASRELYYNYSLITQLGTRELQPGS